MIAISSEVLLTLCYRSTSNCERNTITDIFALMRCCLLTENSCEVSSLYTRSSSSAAAATSEQLCACAVVIGACALEDGGGTWAGSTLGSVDSLSYFLQKLQRLLPDRT